MSHSEKMNSIEFETTTTDRKKILVGLTGSIACYKTCQLISQLSKLNCEIKVIVTPSALQFIGPATLEGLSGTKVYSDTFSHGDMMAHIDLARWADIFVVAPLTANHLNKMALGIADDLLLTTYMAYELHKPLIIAPAMNTAMLKHPTVQESLTKLASRGVTIVKPTHGLLACGETGEGKMAEPDTILEFLFAKKTAPSGKRVLITYGGTREVIDGVRSITNSSTGRTGQILACELSQFGNEIDVIRSLYAPPAEAVRLDIEFESHSDLRDRLFEQISKHSYDVVIHLAAVSDFTVDNIVYDGQKLNPSKDIKLSSQGQIELVLKQTPKIVNQIKEHSLNKKIQVVAFKLTQNANETQRTEAVNRLFKTPGIDLVVHNDLSEIESNSNSHCFVLYLHAEDGAQKISACKSTRELALILNQRINHDSLS